MTTRKHPKYVTIAHISDLHFNSSTQFPPADNSNVHLIKLIRNLKDHQPDLLCVTGDIADNTWRDSLKGWSFEPIGDQEKLEGWNLQLKATFQRSLAFL